MTLRSRAAGQGSQPYPGFRCGARNIFWTAEKKKPQPTGGRPGHSWRPAQWPSRSQDDLQANDTTDWRLCWASQECEIRRPVAADGPSRPSAVLAVVGCGYHRRCARGQCRSGWYSAHYLGACATAPMKAGKRKPRPVEGLAGAGALLCQGGLSSFDARILAPPEAVARAARCCASGPLLDGNIRHEQPIGHHVGIACRSCHFRMPSASCSGPAVGGRFP